MSPRWTETPLGDVITEAKAGFASGADVTDGVLQVRMNNVTAQGELDFSKQRRVPSDDRTSRFSLERGDVLFNATNSPELVGKTALFLGADEPVVFSNHFLRLRTDKRRLVPSYLARWMQYQHGRGVFGAMAQQWVNQAAVRPERLLSLVMPLPPVADQQRIASTLDAADGLRARRRDGFHTLDRLRDAIFASMTASSSWPLVRVADLVENATGGIRTGPFGSQLLHSEFVDAGVAVLGIDNAVANEFRGGAARYISEEKYRDLVRYTVHPGDVLITIMGTCGRVAIVPDDIGVAINTKHLCCISLDQSRCLPSFLHAYFLRHPIARQYLMSRAKGAIMAGLNMGIIKELPVSLPPMEIQQAIAGRLAAIERMERRMRTHAGYLDELFASLQHRSFTGAL